MKIRRLIAAIIMIAGVAFLIHFFWFPVFYVFSGDFLASRFKLPSETGCSTSYRVAINRTLFASILLSAIVVPMVLVVRCITDRTTRFGKWLFSTFSSATFIVPFSCVIVGLHMLLQYVLAMGLTAKRIYGISFCLLELIVLCGLWLWMIGLIRRKRHI